MTFSKEEIQTIIKKLKDAEAEQINISNDAEKLIVSDLAIAWQGIVQTAYQDCFISIRDTTLRDIQDLLALFTKVLQYSEDNLQEEVEILANQIQ